MNFSLDTILIWDDSVIAQTYTDLSWTEREGSFESYLARVMDSIILASENPRDPSAPCEIQINKVLIDGKSDTKERIDGAVKFLTTQKIKYQIQKS